MRILPIILLAMLAIEACAVDRNVTLPPYSFDVDYGVVPKNGVMNLNVSCESTLMGGTAGGIWTGGSSAYVPTVSFTATIPENAAGAHTGHFSGYYRTNGGGSGPPPYWQGVAHDTTGKAVILNAIPLGDIIRIRLYVAGSVTLHVNGASDYEIVRNDAKSAGDHQYRFNYDSMPEATFQRVTLDFTPSDGSGASQDTYPTRFKYLGTVRHSVYNTPDESDATCQRNGQTKTNFTTPRREGCDTKVDDMWNRFQQRVNLNGSGKSLAHGMVQPETQCPDVNNPKYRDNATVNPACRGMQVIANETVAAYLAGGELRCGDKIGIDPGASPLVKTVTDNCPACRDGHHIDNYTGLSGCGPAQDLGNFKTIVLLP